MRLNSQLWSPGFLSFISCKIYFKTYIVKSVLKFLKMFHLHIE